MVLFGRCFLIADENGVDEGGEGLESGSFPDWVFPFSGHGVSEGVAHLTAMDAELPGHPNKSTRFANRVGHF